MPHDRDRESSMWAWLRDALPRMRLRKHVHRVEDSTKSGTPDVEGYVEGGRAFWMELKVAYEMSRTPTVRIKTTGAQTYFAMKRSQVGGLSWYLIRVGRHPNRLHFLIPGVLAECLLDRPLDLDWLHSNSACDPTSSAEQVLRAASQVNSGLP